MYVYRVVRLNFKQEIEILCVLFDRALSIFTMTSIKKHIENLNFRSKILLDHPVCSSPLTNSSGVFRPGVSTRLGDRFSSCVANLSYHF